VLHKISELVHKGTGLMMLGGYETFGNSDWATFGRDVGNLLPVQLNVEGQIDTPVKVEPTPGGLAYYLMRLGSTPAESKAIWDKLPPLDGMNRLGAPKPGAAVLAVRQGTQEPMLVGTQIEKGGRTLAFAGDSTWKNWSRSREAYTAHHRFWQQAVLWLAQQEETGSDLWVKLDRRRLASGGKLPFQVGLSGRSPEEAKKARFRVRIIGPNKADMEVPTTREGDENRGVFWQTDAAGEYRVVVSGKDAAGNDIKPDATARFLVYQDDVETAVQAANHDLLVKLAAAGGGKFHRADEDELARYLEELRAQPSAQGKPKADVWPDWKRNPASSAVTDQIDTLWTSGMLGCFLAFVTLLCLEWFLRRRWGMV
jgi:hypothetical protein